FAAIEEAEKQEDQALNNLDLPELGEASAITSEKLEQAVQRLESKLQEKPKDKPLKKAVRLVRKEVPPRADMRSLLATIAVCLARAVH
ncbi:hypothetical protein CFI03_016105, partial [Paenibacillus sp. ATY16]|nr:hypothetical protein [Paenibacillus sp. ATY16]